MNANSWSPSATTAATSKLLHTCATARPIASNSFFSFGYDNTEEDVLFLIYMERNAFYHAGEAAKSGTNYSFKQNLLNFYVVFLRYFIAEYGIKMFNKELEL